MSIKVDAYQCQKCNEIYLDESKANRCCKCRECKNYIGRWNKKSNYVHCSRGYSCDSFPSKGDEGTYSLFEQC